MTARRVTCSAGVAVYPGDATGREELTERADQAMYAARAHGRYRVCSWSEILAGAAMPSTPPRARN
ncbi:MAG TPA: diguanylate cyclase [Chloroflexota bacterium]|nr:diguanylate cyclase [Chloroflexota bacterium]